MQGCWVGVQTITVTDAQLLWDYMSGDIIYPQLDLERTGKSDHLWFAEEPINCE